MLMKLGKKRAVHDKRTLEFADYVAASLPPTPVSVDWSLRVPNYPMYGNDRCGDCMIATVAHQTQTWSFADNDSLPTTPTEAKVISDYELFGYDPNAPLDAMGNNPTDGGCVMLDVLKLWRSKGLCGNKISAFASIDRANHDHVKLSVDLFGGVMIGVQLPIALQGANQWLAPVNPAARVGDWEPGSWGGHAITVVKFDATGLWVVTWGKLLKMSWLFWDVYCEEAYIAISSLFFGRDMVAPNHFNINAIVADAQALATAA